MIRQNVVLHENKHISFLLSGTALSKISLTRYDLEQFTKNDIAFYGLELSRISSIFIAQIMQLHTHRVIDTYWLLQEVKFLEGLGYKTNTKSAKTFRKDPLKGLKKKHFTDASFITKNLDAHFGYKYGGNNRLTKLVDEAFKTNASDAVDDYISFMAHYATIGGLEERARNNHLTGEWIVFQEFGGENYYLTLASHKEDNDDIYSRVCKAYDLDFPFLRDLDK